MWRASGRRRFTGPAVRFLVPLALLAVPGVAAFLLLRGESEDPAALALDRYAAAWTRGDDAAAAALTDNPEGRGRGAEGQPGGTGRRGRGRAVTSRGESAARVRRHVEGPGLRGLRLSVRLTAVEGAHEWRVRWRETAVHPGLAATPGSGPRWTARGAARSSTVAVARS